jgi:hypothetical protein
MSEKSTIKAALKKIVEDTDQYYCLPCTIDSVDLTKKTAYCLPVDESKADLLNIRLMADNKTGFLIVPKVGSVVIVSFMSNETGYISMFSEVDSILLNGDENGGLIKIQELVDKLNNLEEAFNQHLLLYNAHTHGGVTSGSQATAVPAALDTQTLTPTTKVELENTTVKHGNG